MEDNVYEMSESERAERGIKSLPGSLLEALQLTEKGAMVRKALGQHVFEHFVHNQRIEWERYRVQVTSYELGKYLPVL